MSYYSSRSRSLQRSSYSSPSSRSQTPIRSRSSSIEPSFSRPISRATSLQTLQSTGTPFSSYNASSALNRIKSASVTGLSTPSSYSPFSSYKQQPSLSRYSSTSTTIRTSLVDIRRPPTIDRYQTTTDRFQLYRSKYSGATPVIPPSPKYIRQSSPTPKFYAGSLPYLTSFANQQGIGAYTKLLQYSFAGANRSERSNDNLTSMITNRSVSRNNYMPSSYSRYGGIGSNYSRYGGSDYSRDRYGSTDSSRDRYGSTESSRDRYGSTESSRDRYGIGIGNYSSRGTDRYGSSGSSYFGRSYGNTENTQRAYRGGMSKITDSDDSSDLYKTRFRPTGAMSKYWITPRRLFTG